MSGTLTAQLSNAADAANTAASSTTAKAAPNAASSNQSGSNALASLTNNYQTFLKMLTTQLQNQDPTSPTDTSQFTTELVQFSSVEQQIQTNSSLTQLIQLTQGTSILQSSQLLGKQIEVSSADLSLQQASATIHFTVPSAGSVAVAVYDDAGKQVFNTTVAASQGANSWTWNGLSDTGLQKPDGTYRVGVAASNADGSATTLPFTVIGKATAVHQQSGIVQLQMGALQIDMNSVVAVGG
jgi:flagellar basal-body rod modification protein FlgD